MTRSQLNQILKMMEDGLDGQPYLVCVTLKNGASQMGAIEIFRTLNEIVALDSIQRSEKAPPTYIDVIEIAAIDGPHLL